jgi:hypothetical protein
MLHLQCVQPQVLDEFSHGLFVGFSKGMCTIGHENITREIHADSVKCYALAAVELRGIGWGKGKLTVSKSIP